MDRTTVSLRLRLDMGLQAFDVLKELGAGAFGKAVLVRSRELGSLFVLKILDLGWLTEKERRASIGEVEVLSSLSHPNIIEYYGAFFEHGSSVLHIVLGEEVARVTHERAHSARWQDGALKRHVYCRASLKLGVKVLDSVPVF